MIRHSLGARYAKVLFNTDLKAGALKKRIGDFQTLLAFLNDVPGLRKFLNAPQIPFEEKNQLLEKGLHGKVDPVFLNFLFYLIRKRRIEHIEMIETEYRQRVDEYYGIWEAEMTTAVPIDAEEEVRLKKKMEDHFQKEIKIIKVVDPAILGGAVLVFFNHMIDWSVATRLVKLKADLLEMRV